MDEEELDDLIDDIGGILSEQQSYGNGTNDVGCALTVVLSFMLTLVILCIVYGTGGA